ncbi:MAG: replicative DNA helicase [Planctomycetes bacterium]|nr:replicative DNA helicase [Planctomycetota bacterium]
MPDDPLLDKVPPHSIEAEMSVLGAMLLAPEATGIALQYLDAECFYRPQHRALYNVVVRLYDQNKPVDLVLLREALREGGQLEEVGGDEYLVALADSVPTLANAEHYARVVKEKALLRGLIQAAAEIIRDAHGAAGPVDDVLDRCEKRVFDVTELKIVNQAQDVRTILSQLMQVLDFQGGRAITGVPTGLTDLDDRTRGLQPSEMIVLAARPSVGKSALALNIAEHVGVDLAQPVAFFSLEMSKEELALRLLSSRARVDGQRLRKGMLSHAEAERVRDAGKRLYETPIFIDDSPALRILDLRAKARRLYLRQGIKLIIVDYLQLMTSPGSESRQVEVANISRGLKALARELKVPVLAVAQLRRPVPGQPHGAVPQLSDLRESGAIEQDADVVLMLDREATRLKPGTPEYDAVAGQAELLIAKQRNGPTGLVHLTWLREFTRFENFSPREAEAPAAAAAPSDLQQYVPPQGTDADQAEDGAPADEDVPSGSAGGGIPF